MKETKKSEAEENFVVLHANTSEILISALNFEEGAINWCFDQSLIINNKGKKMAFAT